MRRNTHAAVVILGSAIGLPLGAQSAHLAALEGSGPVVAAEPLIGGLRLGVAGLYADPTSAPRAAGALLGVLYPTYASVQLHHAVVAFRAGPRWSMYYAATEIKNLFDTSLTNVDPGVGALRARAMLVGFDGTFAILSRVIVSAGLGSALDENVGQASSSSIARLHTRVSIGRGASVGLHWTKALGRLAGPSPGRLESDVGLRTRFGRITTGLTLAVSHGATWKYSEVRSGSSFGVLTAIDSLVDLRAGIGRYATAFGATDHEWRGSASLGVTFGNVRLGAGYTGTDLGLGSGYGISISYERDR